MTAAEPNNRRYTSRIVVGVDTGQPDAVVQQAAVFAEHFGAELVCAWVDTGRYVIEEHPDGSVSSLSFDPDVVDLADEALPPRLVARLTAALDGRQVAWSTRALAGDPALAIGRLADTLGAAMIVVGTRESSVRAGLQAFFSGSIAVRLAHRQHRPVVMIPLAPVPFEQRLPWEPA
ncbi:universal stress protein [Cryobacterium breve]|uniref:Universal stress protein n=1 Tax=Cryobacterium breve TaxID=1259258 RepID=A0ABY7N9N3_9MICO|nr:MULTISPECIES: universal stress protein [Cryobacterium]MDY7542065.1 universal stress protein [Cryobacterium sp. 5B3]MEB0001124.1 universal stress protein [Cryobacterium sp. RTS3]MEB0266173.1 universal stress protein [Cryobacterium sp. 10I5]MEB0275496.1 universal stress protein [Cryobacterium sp. 5B3]WBM79014.1 universal stress protein [Cryobacterium breve]